MAGILLLPLWVCAQGVNFRPLSYTEAIELAAKENKMVFIDFYTTWCGSWRAPFLIWLAGACRREAFPKLLRAATVPGRG